MNRGEAIRPLLVTPAADVPRVYAAASGDHNPIHLDPEVAREVGLPAPILHGLYTMAQVARCANQVGEGRRLERLACEFRALGFPGEQIEVTGTVEEVFDAGVELRLLARQGRRRLVRNAMAVLGPPQGSEARPEDD